MEYTEQQKQEFKDRFAEKRKRQWMVAAVVVPLMLLAVLSGEQEGGLLGAPQEALFGLFIAAVLGAVVFSLKNWRCPACNAYLGRDIGPSFCPKCGVALK